MKSNIDLTRLTIAAFFHFSATGTISPLNALYMRSRGLSLLQLGEIISLSTMISLLLITLIGRISDKFGRGRVQVVTGALLAILPLLYILANSFPDFLLLSISRSTVVGVYTPLSNAIAMDFIKDSKGKGFGRFRAIGAIGWVIGTFVGGVVSDWMGFSAVFICSSLFFLISLVFNAKNALAPRRVSKEESQKRETQRELNWQVYTLMIANVVIALTTPAYFTFLPLFMESTFNASKLYISLAFTITPFAEVPAMIYLGTLSDKIGREKVIAICLAGFPLRYLLTMLSGDPVQVIAVQLLHGVTWGGLHVVTTTYLSEITSEESRGFVLSTFSVVTRIGSIIGGYVLALVVEELGFIPMYTLVAVISSLSVPVFYFLKLLKRDTDQ